MQCCSVFYKLLRSKRMINIQSQSNVRKQKNTGRWNSRKGLSHISAVAGSMLAGAEGCAPPPPPPGCRLAAIIWFILVSNSGAVSQRGQYSTVQYSTVARLVNRDTGTLTSAACSGRTASWSPCSSGRGCSGMRRDQACLETVIIGS